MDDGQIQHLLPPEYHGDPINPEGGVLCFQTFGWDLLDTLREIGFESVQGLDYWSAEQGHLGNVVVFLSRRPVMEATIDEVYRTEVACFQ
ncbi:MAG TPA: hypothetical protein PKM59_16585 [Thermodesulfobacteriota bacterium]|nr:hypothetical protein [Thermodesulfobacteriota bacterium]